MSTQTKQLFFTTLIILLTFSNVAFSQTKKLKRANALYNNLAYVEASKSYLEIAESGYQPIELLQNLGNSFYFNADYKNASKWYKSMFSVTKKVAPIYYLRYAQALKATSLNKLAAHYFDEYSKRIELPNKQHKRASDYLEIISSGNYSLNAVLDVNTDEIDYGGAFLNNNTFVFASTKNTNSKESLWDGFSYLDLYQASLKEDGSLSTPEKLPGDINTKLHESTAVFTKDGNTMYFTRSNTLRESKKTKDKIIHLKIYRAHLVDGKWTNVEDLSINNNNYSTAHPTLNDDENILYFASDMPSSLGETDIYSVKINEDNSLGVPQNLGEIINTIGRESFPFITPTNELYFSSDGHFGLGGYDVFYTKINGSSVNVLKNLGTPINSAFDDFAFVIKDKKGYISSNRLTGQGEDDIYSFEELIPISLECKQFIGGIVRDKEAGTLLPNALVTLYDVNGIKVESIVSDKDAAFRFNVRCDTSYKIVGSKNNYKQDSKNVSTSKEYDSILSVTLDLAPVEIISVADRQLLNIKSIYFDFDKYDITLKGVFELAKVVKIMNKYPEIIIEFGSHTDSRGAEKYNWDLSIMRVKSTREWLVNKGIDPKRIIGRGYGETKLVNKCSSDVHCSEADHQLNRRSEFVVLNPEVMK